MTTNTETVAAPVGRSTEVAKDVQALSRARNPLLWIVTGEEARVEGYLIEAAIAAGYVPRTWDVAAGVCKIDGKPDPNFRDPQGQPMVDPGAMLALIRERAQSGSERGAWLMRDLPVWLSGPVGITTQRAMRNLARALPVAERERSQVIYVITPSADVPPELAGHATVIKWPLPDRSEIAALLDATVDTLPDELKATAAPNGTRELAIDAAVGLTGEEASACYSKSLVQSRKIDPVLVAREKQRVIEREGVLEWFDPLPDGLSAVGGLEGVKGWLSSRTNAYTPRARAYKLPLPKGLFVVGVSGCGKSLLAKAIGTFFGVPTVRLDLNALKGKFVGESEGKIRKALSVLDALGRVVVWLDEVEKALQGATAGSADGGVSSDALGTILTWMQERKGGAFIVATANDISALPPEFLRKGRFDEVFFVDVPNEEERGAVLAAALRANGRDGKDIDLQAVADKCEGFTGAEIAELVPDALYTAFADGEREPTTADLIEAAGTVVPLTKTAEAKIKALRDWSVGKARPASKSVAAKPERPKLRALDI